LNPNPKNLANEPKNDWEINSNWLVIIGLLPEKLKRKKKPWGKKIEKGPFFQKGRAQKKELKVY